jgi:transglutaminase-like putative cysteine protease
VYFEGVHHTTYDYSAPVFLEPHTIRLRPRSDPRQLIHEFSIEMTPPPDGMTEGIDVYGNDIVWAWFSETHSSLRITTSFAVETLRENPYDFVVPTFEAAELPPVYPAADQAALFPYMSPSPDWPFEFAKEVAASVNQNFVEFLQGLASRIHATHKTIVRPEGDPLPASVTLASQEGSCRDLAVLFVEACRCVGVAARFVSGYVADEPSGLRELHAWGAAYVPGAGWRGYDPTMGLAVTDRHVTLAAAATPAGAAPVDGRFRGSAVSKLASTIELRTSDAAPEPPV